MGKTHPCLPKSGDRGILRVKLNKKPTSVERSKNTNLQSNKYEVGHRMNHNGAIK